MAGRGPGRLRPSLRALRAVWVQEPAGGQNALAEVSSVSVEPEQVQNEEWAEWYRLTPQERWAENAKMWETFLLLGGSLDPEPDTQSPFFDAQEWRSVTGHGGTGVRAIRRSGI